MITIEHDEHSPMPGTRIRQADAFRSKIRPLERW